MLTRRDALTGTVAALTAAATTTAALAAIPHDADAKLLALSGQYDALRDEALALDRSAPGKPWPVYNAIYDRVGDLYDEASEVAGRMAALEAHTTEGLASKLRVIRIEAGFHPNHRSTRHGGPDERAVALGLWTAIEDVERIVGRVGS